ncbi:MAG: glycosyltransferase [Desulfovibrionales bacterium]
MHISFFGSSLVSAYWNGAATYYRGIVKGLARRGHDVTFYEPDAYERQQHRDMEDPDWAEVVVYPAEEPHVSRALETAAASDVVIKASGVGVFDEFLEREVLRLKSDRTKVIYWDVDAPATLERIEADPSDPMRTNIPSYDLVLTYGGGPPVVQGFMELGARQCVPIYNALDPQTHHPCPPSERFAGDCSFLGNRLPDREQRVEEFFLHPAALLPAKQFLLGGNGWDDKPVPANVARLGHVYTRDHNVFNCSGLAVLNIHRESMARYGYSPATRVFEAAGAGACIISDDFVGAEQFLEPGNEILLARDGGEVAEHLERLTPEESKKIGNQALKRVLSEHTYAHRAELLANLLR